MANNAKASLDEFAGQNGNSDEPQATLQHMRTVGSVSMSAELFEKLYVSPQAQVTGNLYKRFGNPSPIAIIGFLMGLTPLSIDLMGWRGAGGSGAAVVGTIYFAGGLLQVIGGTLEWVIGNTFPAVVHLSFAAFFLSFGATLTPTFNAMAAYSETGSMAEGGTATGFNAAFGFYLLCMGFLCFIFLICALRVNVCFFMIFFTLVVAYSCLAAAYWVLASNYVGHAAIATKLVKAGGAMAFVSTVFGWWAFAAIMFATLDLPFSLPVGDMSNFLKGKSNKSAA